MSVFANIQNLFKPKQAQLEDSMDLASVGAPVDVLATAAREEAAMRPWSNVVWRIKPVTMNTIRRRSVYSSSQQ